MYFYIGKAVEFNGDSFEKHHAQDVASVLDLETMWMVAHKSLTQEVAEIVGAYCQDTSEYPGLKIIRFAF